MKITTIPDGEKISNDFEIKLNGISVKAYAARVSAMPINRTWPGCQRSLKQTEEAGILSFEMSEAVNIELIAAKKFSEVIIRPLYDNIKPEIDGRTIRFKISKPGQYTVELDGTHNALHIFANPEHNFNVLPNNENVIYFPAGVHHPGLITMESNQTLYIDRDAVVYGAILAVNAKNIRILGYGILDGSQEKRYNDSLLIPKDITRRNPDKDVFSPILKNQPVSEVRLPVCGSTLLKDKEQYLEYLKEWNVLNSCIHLYGCTDTEINGVILRDSPSFTIIEANCTNAICDNVKLIGMWRYNSDGIDIFNSKGCVIRNSFLRNFDDCVVLKGIPGWDTMSMEDILVDNCVIWCDWGKSLEIGAETCAPEYKNITFRDCDCIHNQVAAMSIYNCDRAHVHDVSYENIRVEYSKYDSNQLYQHNEDTEFVFSHGVPMLIWESFGKETYYSCERQKGKISHITYKNIQVLSDENAGFPPIVLEGYSKEHNISDIRFEGLTHNGMPALKNDIVSSNNFTENVCIF